MGSTRESIERERKMSKWSSQHIFNEVDSCRAHDDVGDVRATSGCDGCTNGKTKKRKEDV